MHVTSAIFYIFSKIKLCLSNISGGVLVVASPLSIWVCKMHFALTYLNTTIQKRCDVQGQVHTSSDGWPYKHETISSTSPVAHTSLLSRPHSIRYYKVSFRLLWPLFSTATYGPYSCSWSWSHRYYCVKRPKCKREMKRGASATTHMLYSFYFGISIHRFERRHKQQQQQHTRAKICNEKSWSNDEVWEYMNSLMWWKPQLVEAFTTSSGC